MEHSMQQNDLVFLGSNNLITFLFTDPRKAERAYHSLLSHGYDKNDINVIMSNNTYDTYFTNSDISNDTLGTKAAEGMGIGGAVGGTVGALAAALAAMGTSLIIPGLGIVIAGSLAAGIAGAGAGAVTGGLIGALVGYGIPDDQAKMIEDGINRGGVLVSVKARTEEERTALKNEWLPNPTAAYSI